MHQKIQFKLFLSKSNSVFSDTQAFLANHFVQCLLQNIKLCSSSPVLSPTKASVTQKLNLKVWGESQELVYLPLYLKQKPTNKVINLIALMFT